MFKIKTTIAELIKRKQEGPYWDFKRQWYSCNTDMLHDIICMANNLENRDAYIIIGVDENRDYMIEDVILDPNRKNTQSIVDFLKDKKFAGSIRPIVYVESVEIDGKTLDVIVIEKSNSTPFYLEERYKDVNSYNIYTRIQNTNTPKDRSADIDKVELLWRKRFGLLETPLEQLKMFIKNKEDWVESPIDGLDIKYYKYRPEFTIEKSPDETITGYELYTLLQTDHIPLWCTLHFRFHQTVLASFQAVSLDGGRCLTTTPKKFGYSFDNELNWKYYYMFFLQNSLEYLVHAFITDNNNSEAQIAYKKFSECILFFVNETEKNYFDRYVINNLEILNKHIASCKEPYLSQIKHLNMSFFHYQYKVAKAFKNMLEEFRRYVEL